MVAPVVAKAEPGGRRAGGLAEHLVPEADAEDRDPALEQPAGELDLIGQPGGVARAVAQHHAVGLMTHHLVEVGVVPDGDHLRPPAGQRPELVALETEVHGDDPDPAKAPDPPVPEHSELQLDGERLLPAPPGLGLGDLGHQVAIADPGRPAGQVHLRLRGERRGDGQHLSLIHI